MIRPTIAAALTAAAIAAGVLPALAAAQNPATIAGYSVSARPLVFDGGAYSSSRVTAPAGPGGTLTLRVYREGSLLASKRFIIPAHKAGNYTARVGAIVCAPVGPLVTITATARLAIVGRGFADASSSRKRIC